MQPENYDPFCALCQACHPEDAPHWADTLHYQMSFYRRHGRVPSYRDAAAHCSREMRDIARQVADAYGIDFYKPAGLQYRPDTIP